jgi:hypothetical protein
VRWRLSRALALLRERLDRGHGGDRRAWSLAFLPLARLDAAGASAAAAVLPGVVLMNVLKLSVAAAAILVVALGLSLAGVLPDALTLGHREQPLAVTFRPLEAEVSAATASADEPAVLPAPERTAVEPRAAASEATVTASSPAALDARFEARGRAVSAASLVVVRGDERSTALSGPDGLASLTFTLDAARELVRVEYSAPGYASRACEAVCEQGATTHLGRIELVPGGAVSGRLLDERGRPVGEARVTLGSLDEPYQRLEAARLDTPEPTVPAAVSDANGHFRLLGVPAGMTRLWAHADGKKASYSPPLEVRAGQESLGVELVLEPLASENVLRGIVLDPTGSPVPRAEIEYRHVHGGGSTTQSGTTRADAQGRFEFLLPGDARSWLRGTDPAGRWNAGALSDLGNSAEEQVLQLREARSVELLVQTRSGEPISNFAAELRGVDPALDFEELVEDQGPERAAELVAQYAPRLGGLPRGEHPGGRARLALPEEPFYLRVLAPGHRVFQRGPLEPARTSGIVECALEPVPGLAGVVLRAGSPVSGVRVELRTEVGPDTEVLARGYRQRLWPEAHDETRTDAEGRFLLTAQVPGRYHVRALPETGAPAEAGPFELDATLGAPPLVIELGLGGAIEGRVLLASGADPEGSIVGLTRGDGGERTQRVGGDGRFRFEALIPGPWRVDLCTEEVFGPPGSISSTRSPRVRPFELEANCTVIEGQTTFVDVSDATPEALLITGRLTIDERPAVGWAARFGPAGVLEFEEGSWTALDSDGRFELRPPRPGRYRLMLRQQGGEHQEQYLFEDLELDSDTSWERALHTGRLRLVGGETWDGEGMPRAVHHWRGTGQLFSLAVPVAQGDGVIEVPAGQATLRAPNRSSDPEDWPVLKPIDVPRGGEIEVDLRGELADDR